MAQAAMQLRGASDLLAVHLDAWGRQRSPDATTIGDPAAPNGALVQVAGHRTDHTHVLARTLMERSTR